MLQISNLQFQYPNGEFQLNLPKLQIKKGEKVALIGSSGCGKTTLLQLISGIKSSTGGSIQINDVCIEQLSESQQRQFRITQVGFIFQNFELLDYLTVMDNILHPYRLSPALKLTTEVRQRVLTLAQQVAVDNKLNRNINSLSQGEKQRVAICRALLPRPTLLLADEATGNLDPANKQRVLDILFLYVEHHSAPLLAVTHDYDLLDQFDRVVEFGQF